MKAPSEYKPTEHQIMNAIIGYLWAKGYYAQRMNAGKMSIKAFKRDSYTGVMRQANRVIQMSAPGTPDIMAFKPMVKIANSPASSQGVHLIYIEVKRPGNKPTLLQETKMRELESFGAKCIVATGSEDLQRAGI